MALYDTPSLADFRQSQQQGIFNFKYPEAVKEPQRILDNPNVDSSTKDAIKVNQYASAAVPTSNDNINIMERVLAEAQPISKIFTNPTPLAENLNNSLSKRYQSLASANNPQTEILTEVNQIDPARDSSFDFGRYKKDVASKESDNNYKLQSKVSSAVGKYQFLWGTFADKIKKVTGVQSKTDFANNPQAQEKFFQWYTSNEIIPQAKKLQAEGAKKGFSLLDMAKLVHFRGPTGAKNLLKWDPKKYESRDMKNNMGIYEYLDRHVKKGGR